MSAIVCGKRSYFEDLPASPQPGSSSKRIRCSSSTSPVRFSSYSYPPPALLDHLTALFPNMDNQTLERVLDTCGNDLDAAVKSLHKLSLGYEAQNSDATKEPSANVQKELAGAETNDRDAVPSADPSGQNNLQIEGAEWVELFVKEMMGASSIDDARSRAAKVLESLEQSISSRTRSETAQNYLKENAMLKQQIDSVLRENTILKRAVSIQHERQKEYDDRNHEVQYLKQMVTQYQEQLRTLEVNNYALTMHLQQAQQSNSIPDHFNPDIF